MKLNRTPNPLDRNARNGENDNWDIIEGETRKISEKVDNFIDEVSDAALDKVIDNAKLNWKEPVDSFGDLPSSAQKGDTRMDKTTGKVYRYDGTNWVEIQQIDAGPVNELDSRLSSQLAETAKKTYVDLELSKKASKQELEQGLALKADQSFVDAQFASIVSGAPKGTFANLQALKDTYPNGEEGVFLVLSDGNWYYWNEEENDWLVGGLYQAVSWEAYMTEQNEEWVI